LSLDVMFRHVTTIQDRGANEEPKDWVRVC